MGGQSFSRSCGSGKFATGGCGRRRCTEFQRVPCRNRPALKREQTERGNQGRERENLNEIYATGPSRAGSREHGDDGSANLAVPGSARQRRHVPRAAECENDSRPRERSAPFLPASHYRALKERTTY